MTYLIKLCFYPAYWGLILLTHLRRKDVLARLRINLAGANLMRAEKGCLLAFGLIDQRPYYRSLN